MCDKLELGCVVVGGGTGGAVLGKRFLALTPSVATMAGQRCH
jgi:hypothetical protein